MKWPFMKFYPRDWQADAELRMCSLESRGYWFECLCIMHHAKRRGYLETPQGHSLSDEQIARLMATFKGDVKRCKEELLVHGVPSIEDGTGTWYCRRMVKETSKSVKCSEASIRGGGNPYLKSNLRNQKPETRNHISLKVNSKVTFKGQQPTEENISIFARKYAEEANFDLTGKKSGKLAREFINYYNERDWCKAGSSVQMDDWRPSVKTWIENMIEGGEIKRRR